MDASKAQAIVSNLAVFCVGTMALGLVISWWTRRRATPGSFSMRGRVQARPYDLIDLGVTAILISYLLLPLIAAATQGTVSKEPIEVSNTTIIINAILIAIFSLLLGIGVFIFASVLRGRKPVALFGLSRLAPVMILLWAAAAVLTAYYLMIGVVFLQELLFDPGDQLQKAVKTLLESDNTALKVVTGLSAIIVAPLVEEIIFRGYLYPVIKRYAGCFFAAITTSLLFAVIHGNLPGIMPLFTLALILTLAYELTGCLWVPIVAHSLFNLTQVYQMLNIQNG